MPPETRYARDGDIHVAYQISGRGARDMVLVSSWFSHLEYRWEFEPFARWLGRLGTFSRLLSFDKRGVGLSDPVSLGALPTLEEWMDDVDAVTKAAGSVEAAVLGVGEGGLMAMLYAVTHPERVTHLILSNTLATVGPRDGYAPSVPLLVLDPESVGELWGTGVLADIVGPSFSGDESFRIWWRRFERHTASPGTLGSMVRMLLDIDVRTILTSIQTPTLVIHARGNRLIPVDHGRYLAATIPGARYVELPGADHVQFGEDMDAAVDHVEEFVTGVITARLPERIVATMLFTDIVDSTTHASRVGDHRWHQLLDAHDVAVRREIDRYRGREINTTGDGFLASFGGPARAIHCALAIIEAAGDLGLTIRAGIHTGEVEMRGDDLGGIAVHIAARISALASGGEVLVSGTVRDLVSGSGIPFSPRGEQLLKGVPEAWRVFSVDRA